MSFTDIKKGGSNGFGGSGGGASRSGSIGGGGREGLDMSQLTDALQSFQKNCLKLKDKITEMRRRKVDLSEKSELDSQIKEIKDFETKLKNQVTKPLFDV